MKLCMSNTFGLADSSRQSRLREGSPTGVTGTDATGKGGKGSEVELVMEIHPGRLLVERGVDRGNDELALWPMGLGVCDGEGMGLALC